MFQLNMEDDLASAYVPYDEVSPYVNDILCWRGEAQQVVGLKCYYKKNNVQSPSSYFKYTPQGSQMARKAYLIDFQYGDLRGSTWYGGAAYPGFVISGTSGTVSFTLQTKSTSSTGLLTKGNVSLAYSNDDGVWSTRTNKSSSGTYISGVTVTVSTRNGIKAVQVTCDFDILGQYKEVFIGFSKLAVYDIEWVQSDSGQTAILYGSVFDHGSRGNDYIKRGATSYDNVSFYTSSCTDSGKNSYGMYVFAKSSLSIGYGSSPFYWGASYSKTIGSASYEAITAAQWDNLNHNINVIRQYPD